MPVPAGMSLPMMMFSLRPSNASDFDSMAASVSTRVVSWKDAAESHESVARDALVAVHLLHLADEVVLRLADALDLEQLLGIAGALDQRITRGDLLAVGD